MYEDNEQPVLRRVLLTTVWLVIVITIAWATIWLAFFRHNNDSTSQGSLKHQTSQQSSGSKGNKAEKPGNNGPSAGSTGQSNTPVGTGSTTPQPPQTLANTGAGNVFVPFAVASVVGTAVYYVRLRKKLTQ